MKNENEKVQIITADPSALGLFGLAIVTLVASSQKLGITSNVSLVIPWAIFLGSIAQLFACVNDCKRNNVFGTTAFGAYGLFWLGVAFTWLIQYGVFGETMAAKADVNQLGIAFVGYFIFTMFMTVGASEVSKVLFIIFILIDFLFIGLAMSTFGIMKEFFHMVAAISELLVALVSFYGCAAAVLNATFGKTFLPIGKPLGRFK